MTKEDFIRIIDCFEHKNNAIGDLCDLFLKGTAGQADMPRDSSISYLDAIFELTSRQLTDDGPNFKNDFKNSYYSLRNDIQPQPVYRNACKSINGKDYDISIFDNWKAYLADTGLLLTRNTSLKQLLNSILNFAKIYYSNTNGFINFLTKIQAGVSAKNLIGTNAGASITSEAMRIVTDNIEAAAKPSAKKCVIFTGSPGTGKTYCVENYVNQKMTGFKGGYFVQFHSSYDYTDFVEGIRPVRNNGSIDYVRMDGIFKAFCREVVRLNQQAGSQTINAPQIESPEREDAEEAPESGETRYYFVIDEINRADLGRVFGELMYCFEKRGEEHTIPTQYTNLPTCGKDGNPLPDDCFQKGFYIPENVVIIGTMNDIDRSVETFDFALRRRFNWVEIEADEVMESSLAAMVSKALNISALDAAKKVADILPNIKALNSVIEAQSGLGKEFKIGPAYFKDYDGSNLPDIWEHNIEPILREYMRGRQNAPAFIRQCYEAIGLESSNNNASAQSGDAQE